MCLLDFALRLTVMLISQDETKPDRSSLAMQLSFLSTSANRKKIKEMKATTNQIVASEKKTDSHVVSDDRGARCFIEFFSSLLFSSLLAKSAVAPSRTCLELEDEMKANREFSSVHAECSYSVCVDNSIRVRSTKF